jgi:galactokinase
VSDRVATVRAPGRAELLGNHTDTSEGLVLGVALERGVEARARCTGGDRITITSLALGSRAELPLLDLDPLAAAPWARIALGAARELQERGASLGGVEIELGGDLPVGAGLASSAAVGIATTLALAELFPPADELALIEIAKLAQSAEHRFAGVRCGLLDQVTCLMARAGHVVMLDCRTLAVTQLPWRDGYELALIRSGVGRELASSSYNRRRDEVEAAAARLGVRSLRDATAELLDERGGSLEEPLRRRARHVVTENARVIAGAAALECGDMDELGRLMLASHDSSRDDFECSCVELDCLVELARLAPGCPGARLTGAGWGGAIIALVESSLRAQFELHLERETRRHFGLPRAPLFFVPAAGAGTAITRGDGSRS